MKKLVLVEHSVPETVQRGGYTVRPGNFFGYLFEDGQQYPAFWSGWISGYCIALYVMRDGIDSFQWIDEDDLDEWDILTERDYLGEYTAEWLEANRASYGAFVYEGDYVPFFQKYID